MEPSLAKIYIHATNIHVGGGRTLLTALLRELRKYRDVTAFLDARMELEEEVATGLAVVRVCPTVFSRFMAEHQLANLVHEHDLVLCFGNLPPLFKLRARTFVFMQNRYLIDPVPLQSFSRKVRLRLECERLWLAHTAQNVDEFIVQTPSMERVFAASGKAKGRPIHVLPFASVSHGYRRALGSTIKRDPLPAFVYVASGEPHKNHRNLIKAWCLLAEENIFPSLKVTLSPDANPELCDWMQRQIELFRLQLENLGTLSYTEVQSLYASSQALVFPSTFESFGLPLIEARQAGLAILASELDYVRDVVDPEEAFDPSSPISIAQAVKRFLGVATAPLPLLSAHEFLAAILKR